MARVDMEIQAVSVAFIAVTLEILVLIEDNLTASLGLSREFLFFLLCLLCARMTPIATRYCLLL